MDSTKKLRFTFRPVVESQQVLIHEWLKQDYIQEWIHGEGLQNTLKGLTRFIQDYSVTKKIDRESELTQHWIGYERDRPFVYLLTSNIFKGDDSVYSSNRQTNGLAITLDMFIGDRDYLGKGFAAQIIREFLVSHFSDVSEVFIDPEQSNKRAVHVYQKAGFQIIGDFIASWHPVPHYLMRLEMKNLL